MTRQKQHRSHLPMILLLIRTQLILTERLEELGRGELPVEENGAVVDVENSAHADEQDLQASCSGGPQTEAETWRDGQRRGRRRQGRGRRALGHTEDGGQDTPAGITQDREGK